MPDQYFELEEMARRVRIDAVRMIHKAGSGHPGSSLSTVDIMVALYFQHMKHDPENPFKIGADRFVLSKGHAAPALYSVLAHSGYFPPDELMRLRQPGSRLQGHRLRACSRL